MRRGAPRRLVTYGDTVSDSSRTLLLLRHGKSDYPPGVTDHQRPLAPRGVHEAALAGDWLRAHAPAVDAVLSGADIDEVASVLAERDGAVLSARLGALSDDRAAEVRRRFLSCGTCSIAEPLEDLLGLGLAPSTVSPITEGTNA